MGLEPTIVEIDMPFQKSESKAFNKFELGIAVMEMESQLITLQDFINGLLRLVA